MSTTESQYQERIVVFLDFLGFKSHIDRTVKDPAHVTRIARAFNTVRDFTNPDEGWEDRVVTQFSDCVVLSYRIDQRSAVFDILMTMLLLQVELANQGFLVRGGITAGPLLHEESMVFGPALVEAHRMESKDAVFPRILVDPELVQVARDYPALHHSGTDEARYVRSFLTDDEDGKSYLNYVPWKAVVEDAGVDADAWPGYMNSLSRILRDGLASGDAEVVKKMLWLHRQYREAINEFIGPTPAPELLAKHQHFFEALTSLPCLDVEVAVAESKLAEKKWLD